MSQTRREDLPSAISRRALAAGVGAVGAFAVMSNLHAQPRRNAIVIARGGAAGGWPAGSRGAYDQAASDGADFLESGIVPTKDGVLIARQDDDLGADTTVAAHAEFADRRATRVIDGKTREGWFCEDFTLAEIKSLALRLPGGQDRRPSAQRAEKPAVLTLEELMAAARAASVRTARVVGVYATLLHPKYFATLDLPLEPGLARIIRAQGYNSPAAAMFVAGDDPDSLKAVGDLARTRRVRRWRADQGPAPSDFKALAQGLAAVALPASWLIDAATPKTIEATDVVGHAHDAGLPVHAWVGDDEAFPPAPLKPGDGRRALAALFAAGADGLSTDLAAPAARARADAVPSH